MGAVMLKIIERVIFPCAGKLEAACAEHHEVAMETLDALKNHHALLVAACKPSILCWAAIRARR